MEYSEMLQVLPSGVYDVYHYDGTQMHVDEEGVATVQPRSNQDLEVHDPSHELRSVTYAKELKSYPLGCRRNLETIKITHQRSKGYYVL